MSGGEGEPDQPLVSVVLPTRDRPELLARAITSVQHQTLADWELVVVDDGQEHPAVAPEDPRVRVVATSGGVGPAAARNVGLDVARGRYVGFLDDDDVFAPARLERAVAAHTGGDVVVCGARFEGEVSSSRGRLRGWVTDTVLDGPTPSLGRTTVDRGIVPRFDERWRGIEDVEWWLRLAVVAPVVVVPHGDYVVGRHDGVRAHNDLATRAEENRRFVATHPYFVDHQRSAAYRLRRAGLQSLDAGDPRAALADQLASLRRWPTLRSARHALRAIVALRSASSAPR